MGLFSDILEKNRERELCGYLDSCRIMSSLQQNDIILANYWDELNKYETSETTRAAEDEARQMYIQKSASLEKLKAGYLVAEKAVFEIINRGNIKSDYMKDTLGALQSQLNSAYTAICLLRNEIDKRFDFQKAPDFFPTSETSIRADLLSELIQTTLYHTEQGMFADTSTFRKVVSDCAEVIRCLKNEEYHNSDKSVFTYYLTETFGLKRTRLKCKNCGTPLLDGVAYCLNCYERNISK